MDITYSIVLVNQLNMFFFLFRDILESRDMEYKAWVHVQNLKSSLDEHCLEARVKTAIEAEAISQQRLATAEAEIADLRQKLEFSLRYSLLSFVAIVWKK